MARRVIRASNLNERKQLTRQDEVIGFFQLTCSQSTILFANCGVNCQACCIVSPSMSKITSAPAIWVAGSYIAPSKNKTIPLNTSSRGHFFGFHFSVNEYTTKSILKNAMILWRFVEQSEEQLGEWTETQIKKSF